MTVAVIYPVWFVPTVTSPHLGEANKSVDLHAYRDTRFVLAKGAGPGIYNRWNTNANGVRMFFARVHRDYLR